MSGFNAAGVINVAWCKSLFACTKCAYWCVREILMCVCKKECVHAHIYGPLF